MEPSIKKTVSPQILPLKTDSFCAGASLLTEAFSKDPLFKTLFKGSNQKKQMLSFFTFMLQKSVYLKEKTLALYVDQQLNCIANLELPESKRGSSIFLSLPFIWKSILLATRLPFSTFKALNAYMLATSKARPSEPHHYLVSIGVDPAKQGMGYGKEMLHAIHEMVDAHPDSIGIGLDTENPDNIPLYEHFGYRLTHTQKLGQVTLYCMFRKA